MEIEGRLLNFETNDAIGYRYSKDCKIDIQDVIPIINKFDKSKFNAVIGHASVSRDENGLSISGTIFDETLPLDTGIGGYFTILETKKFGDVDIVTDCKLRSIGITAHPVSPDYYWREKKRMDKEGFIDNIL